MARLRRQHLAAPAAAAAMLVAVACGARHAAPGSEPTEACTDARDAFESLLGTLPDACVDDHGCAAFYLRPDPCARAVVLSRVGVPEDVSAELAKRKKAVVKRCPPPTAHCEAPPSQVRCQAGHCVDALAPRG